MTRITNKPLDPERTEKIRDLLPGDEAFILNGNRTRAKAVEVISAQDGVIRVLFTDERGDFEYDFDPETGMAIRDKAINDANGVPVLTVDEDPRLAVVRQRVAHRDFRVQLEAHANAFNVEPTKDHFDAMVGFIHEWGEHSVGLDLITNIAALTGEQEQPRDLTTDPVVQQHNAAVSRSRGTGRPGF